MFCCVSGAREIPQPPNPQRKIPKVKDNIYVNMLL